MICYNTYFTCFLTNCKSNSILNVVSIQLVFNFHNDEDMSKKSLRLLPNCRNRIENSLSQLDYSREKFKKVSENNHTSLSIVVRENSSHFEHL